MFDKEIQQRLHAKIIHARTEKHRRLFARQIRGWIKRMRCALHQFQPVSYTHLDVYKRQAQASMTNHRETAMRTVRQLLDAKSAEIIAIGPDAPVYDAIRLMGERGVGALLVMEGPTLVGILSCLLYTSRCV